MANKSVVRFGRKILNPLVELLARKKVAPNALTVTGFLLTLPVAFLYAMGHTRLAGVFLAIAGSFDAVDGEVARRTGRVSKFGALLDSTLDRFSEFLIFGGMLYFYRLDNTMFFVLFFSLIFSILISYVRARGEGLGVSIRSGLMDRVGRYIYLILASLIDGEIFRFFMYLFVFLTALTVVARISKLYNSLTSE